MYFNCHTGFSFKYGTIPVKQLFEEARRCGVEKLAITEINNTASYMEMLRVCNEHAPCENGRTKFDKQPYNLEIAVGIEFRRDHELLYIALARNNEGFERINRFLSYHNRESIQLPSRGPEDENIFLIYPYEKMRPEHLKENEFIGVRKHQISQYAVDPERRQFVYKFVAWQPITFLPPEVQTDKNGRRKPVHKDFNIHRLLRAISNNTLLSKLPEHEQALPDEFMKPEAALEKEFEMFPELCEKAKWLLNACSLQCLPGIDKNKKFFSDSLEEDLALLRVETKKGYDKIYRHKDVDGKIWKERIEKELTIIQAKKFTAYYLICYDLISFAKQRNFDFVGRGSGANSTVAYCLGITNVDPIELNLYFERFLNEERVSPPDFDIDFSWDNRDDIYAYLFTKYQRDHVCLLGTHVTYQSRSVLRELGKVFGLPKEEIDELVENPHRMKDRDHITTLVFRYAQYIIDKELPSTISIHAGGVLITEKPIYSYTATDMPPKGLPVSHFEMHSAEDFGIYKFDILSQRGLGHIKETAKHISTNKGLNVNVHDFENFKKDDKIKELLRNSRTMGCFYVESPAMRMLLGKLKCEDYLTLVAASSIIRPGVASSGMMRAYIERFHTVRKGGSYDAIHPKMQQLMTETFGVMVYQEDVIKVAHEFAGLTLTEADVLRRGMSGKYRSREEFQRVKDKFFQNCRGRYEQQVIERVWYEIESFSGYSFAKGHSASYAVESYQSLFLKAHYPLEFMVGVINNFGGFYRTEFYFHEARMCGGKIEAPCVNNSQHLTSIKGDHIFMGFIHIKGMEATIAKDIPLERDRQGEFKSLDNFLRRVSMGLEQVRILIRMGAFRFTGKNKQRLLWEAMLFFGQSKLKRTAADLFDTEPREYPLPQLTRHEIEDAFDEIELIGFPLCDPFKLLATNERGDALASTLLKNVGRAVHITGYVVTTKDSSTKKGEAMHFGTFLDQNGEVFDTVHFPDIAKRFPFRGRGFYSIKGKVVEDFGVGMIEVSWMDKLPLINKRADEFMREHIDHPAVRQQRDNAA